jgi:hypothetical protein
VERAQLLHTYLLIPALLLAALSFACGGDDDSDEEDEPADSAEDSQGESSENDLAESLLLTVDDFPPGWAEAPLDESETADEQLEECDQESDGKTGEAQSEDFSDNDTREISQQLAVFTSPDEVGAALDQAESQLECLRDAVLDGAIDTDQASVTDASLGAVSFREFGDRTDAYRLTLVFEAEGNEVIDEAEVYLDAVYVLVDRVGFGILAFDVFSPFSTTELEEIVETATGKVSRALESDNSHRRRRGARVHSA